MRIVFIGSVEFSRSALTHLLYCGAKIVGVCTLRNGTINSDYVDLTAICEKNRLSWAHVGDINSVESLSWIRDRAPDVIFCFGWSRLLKQDLIKLAPLGVIGFHPAALPSNRGRHPLIWALVLGLKKTASTFFFMDSSPDSGDILSQREVVINEDDDARSLYDRVTRIALDQIDEFLPLLATGAFTREKQDENLANTWRKRSKADGEIDWRMSARSINNLVRGLAKPYVGAHFVLNQTEVKVWKSAIVYGVPENVEPGRVLLERDSKIVIKCGEDAITLLATEPEFFPVVGSYL